MFASKNKFRRLVLIAFVISFYSSIKADIVCCIKLYTTKWAPIAYLSIIPGFSQMNTISFSNIIERSSISEDGVFRFQTRLLPDENNLYRIHISKIGDPPASLIIGSKNNNHFFLFAKKDIEIHINSESDGGFFQGLVMEGYNLNKSLLEVNRMRRQLDSFDYFGTTVNSEFARKSIFNEMRYFADTCSLPLVALYSICQSDYESDYLIHPDFYINYLNKWDSEESLYFNSFRNQLGYESATNWIGIGFVILIIFLLATLSFLYLIRNKNKASPLHKLTLQERRIYYLLKDSKSNKEMASDLSISLSTVKSHVNKVYSKLGVNSMKEILDHNFNKS